MDTGIALSFRIAIALLAIIDSAVIAMLNGEDSKTQRVDYRTRDMYNRIVQLWNRSVRIKFVIKINQVNDAT